MLDFERGGCDFRYTIIISFESSKGTGTGETNGILEQILNYSWYMFPTFLAIYLHCGRNITCGGDGNSGKM